MKYVKLHLLLY